jgi:hypothetical protein
LALFKGLGLHMRYNQPPKGTNSMRPALIIAILASMFVIGCKCDCEDPTLPSAPGSPPSDTSAPTPTPTPDAESTPTPTVDPSTLMFTLCRAKPSVIDEGESFEIQYAVTYGKVRLARKGESAFVMGLPSEGSYKLRKGKDGYPLGTGVQKYRCISAVNRLVREVTSVEVRP